LAELLFKIIENYFINQLALIVLTFIPFLMFKERILLAVPILHCLLLPCWGSIVFYTFEPGDWLLSFLFWFMLAVIVASVATSGWIAVRFKKNRYQIVGFQLMPSIVIGMGNLLLFGLAAAVAGY